MRIWNLFIGITTLLVILPRQSLSQRSSETPARTPSLIDDTWGVVSPGVEYVITPSGFKEPPGPGEGAGSFVDGIGIEVRGDPHAHITVHLNLPDAFVTGDSSGFVPLTYWTYGQDPVDCDFHCEGGVVNGDSATVLIGDDSLTTLFLGGTLTVPPSAIAGTYTARVVASLAGTTDTTITRTLHVVEVTPVDEPPSLPSSFVLHPNFPNPFNPSTTISFELPEAAWIRLAVFNLVGEEVALLLDEQKETGTHAVSFNAGNLPSGVYVYRLRAGVFSDAGKMLLTK